MPILSVAVQTGRSSSLDNGEQERELIMHGVSGSFIDD